ncbi:MAG: hypothetical protein WCQ99_04240 [Pseudomonadota bacterium]
MQILVCIDDTDSIDSRGTGELASLLARALENKGWGKSEPITRHQMLVHPDIPYTSHNSSMCFAAQIDPEYLTAFLEFARDFLTRESAEGSDPGLCVVNLDELTDPEDLIAFGLRAKKQVLTKEEAYDLAGRLHIHLSEHGGTGLGIIGSLAGTGLRMTGNDGRFRGKFKIEADSDVVAVAEIKRQTGIHLVKSLDGRVLLDSEKVRLGEKVKAVLLEGKATLLVLPGPEAQGLWQACTQQHLKAY